jgi:hypothetical protein
MGKKKVIELKQEVKEEKYPLNEWGLKNANLYLHQQNRDVTTHKLHSNLRINSLQAEAGREHTPRHQ